MLQYKKYENAKFLTERADEGVDVMFFIFGFIGKVFDGIGRIPDNRYQTHNRKNCCNNTYRECELVFLCFSHKITLSYLTVAADYVF